jgi:tetratricopeptide (TPR) repeat protein
MDALRRRYQDRVAQAKAVEARKYAAKAEAALASGDAIAAASALRVANSLAPTDAELERKNREAQEKADALLCDTYERQATYEEKQGRWMEAARSWARVCRSRSSDARAHERAANALVKAAGDTHEAVRLAQRACELDPKNGAYRVTLAKAYLAADLTLNARRELERAAQIAPYDDTIHEMLKRVEALA